MLGTERACFSNYSIIGKPGSVQASDASYIALVVAVIIGTAVGEEITGTSPSR
ncbi:hypothetical protein [Halomonas sp. ND22Bw]|uniref:hypothetical protein n=1 Tax=Halomonas sp. ND22Bw TaxID=2054178 RepID=UPI000A8EDB2C